MLIYKQNNLIIYYNREFCNQNIKFQITDIKRFRKDTKIMKEQTMQKVHSLFTGWNQTIIWSCLDETMGQIIVDNDSNPQSALAILGINSAFAFFAGKPNLNLITTAVDACSDLIMVPQNTEWANMIEKYCGDQVRKFTRYATLKDTNFDIPQLQLNIEKLPPEFQMHSIDANLYDQCLQKEWSTDLVGNYSNYDEFKKLGLGYVIVNDQSIVAGASSFSSYQNGIEIEVATHPDFQRRGLATIACSQLIITCLDQSLYPSWDAHTEISLHLAQKLGYQFAYKYLAYEIEE